MKTQTKKKPQWRPIISPYSQPLTPASVMPEAPHVTLPGINVSSSFLSPQSTELAEGTIFPLAESPSLQKQTPCKRHKHISFSPLSSFCIFSSLSPVFDLSVPGQSPQNSRQSQTRLSLCRVQSDLSGPFPAPQGADSHVLKKPRSVHFSFSNSTISFFPSAPPLLLKSPISCQPLPDGYLKWASPLHPPKLSSFLSFVDSFDYDPPLPYQDDAVLPHGPRKSRISPLFVPLKPIPETQLNLSYLCEAASQISSEFSSNYQTLISYITDLDSFLSLFLSSPPHVRPGKRSKLSKQDVADLLEWKVLSPCPRRVHPPFFHFAFKVLKSDPSWSRFIIDCTLLNSHQKNPPSYSLPCPLRIILTILACDVGFVTDFSAWFPQHRISPDISPFFALRVNSSPLLCPRLAQGWKFSPSIAQGSSLILVFDPLFPDATSLTWIDDNFFGDLSRARLELRRDNFIERCAQANAQIGSISDISEQLVYVGMEFNLAEKKWRIKTSWTEKLLSFISSLSISNDSFCAPTQVLWILLGSFLWFLRCSCRPLALLDPLISQAIDIAPRLIDGSISWSDVISFWPSTISCCLSLISMVEENSWRFVPHSPPLVSPSLFLFSDASLTGGAVVCGDKVIWSTTWDFETAHTDILYLETLAWAAGVRLLPTLGILSAVTVTDNEALYFSLLKTRSKNPKVGSVIADVCQWAETKHLLLFAGWTSTSLMPADGPSRGQPLGSFSPSRKDIRLSDHPFVFAYNHE